MYLQLSENNKMANQTDNANPYIFIPDVTGNSKGFFVREDNFDDLSNAEWAELLQAVAPLQPQVKSGSMSEEYFLSNRASRKAKREEKRALKTEKKKAKTAIKNARAESIATGKRGDTVKNIFGAIASTASSIFGKGDTPPTDSTDVEPGAPPTDAGGGDGDTDKAGFWTKGRIGLAIGAVVVIGGIAYAVNKKRKRKQ